MSKIHHPQRPDSEHQDDRKIIELLEESLEVQVASLRALRRIERELLPPQHRTETAEITFGENTMATPGKQIVGYTLTATFQPIEADGTTITPGSVLTTQPTWTSSDTAVATVTANADGTATVLGVGAGTAIITATAGSFTDLDGTVVGPLDATNTDAVTAPTGRTVSAQISFA